MPEMMIRLLPNEIEYVLQTCRKKGRMAAADHMNLSYPTFQRLLRSEHPRLGVSAYKRLEEAMLRDDARPPTAPACAWCGDPEEPGLKARCLPCAAVEEQLPRIAGTEGGQRALLHALQDARKIL